MSDENHEPDEQWIPMPHASGPPACEHQWEWVQPKFVTVGQHEWGKPNATYNARCGKCGETTWAHGWNVPAPTHPGERDPVLEQEC